MIFAALTLFLPLVAQDADVRFAWDATRLKSIYVNGACILGDDVHTSGGYLIGSADGSDAQGKSVISVGGNGSEMKSDDPGKVPPPPMHLGFERTGPSSVAFSASVGPVDHDFAAMSLPFDFGRKMMDSFAFAGDHYTIFSSENDCRVLGSSGAYAYIKPKAEIRDLNKTLIGKVGGASTDVPTSWAGIGGPYAEVKFTITRSRHFEKVVFMNHPGTHNVEFGLGKLKKGESASIEGEIVVTPKEGPSNWEYDGPSEFYHQVGRQEADGWSVSVGDKTEQYMSFGPYATEIGVGPRVAAFRLMLDNVTFDNAKILTIDVFDSTHQKVLASADLTRGNFSAPMEYEDFPLRFMAPYGAKLEFRTLWHGASYTRERGVAVYR